MRKFWILLLLALMLTGCKTIADIKPDTIVDIPLHPTEAVSLPTAEPTAAPTQAATAPVETVPQPTQTEPPTEAPTAKPDNASSGGRSGTKTSGKGDGGSKSEATQPPTQPPTQAPTDPPTDPPTEAITAPPACDPADYRPGSLDRAVADAVNAQRQEAGLPELTFDSRLCAIASVRAYELSQEWSHRRPDGSDGLTVLDQYGYSYSWAAENLYNGWFSGDEIVARWMTSKSAAGNILSESAALIGVGTYTTADGLTYVAAMFAG